MDTPLPPLLPPLLLPHDVAFWLFLPTSRVEKMARRGLIPYVQLPTGEIRFDQAEVAAWLENHRHKQTIPDERTVSRAI